MLLRKARITDVEPIHALINYYAGKGLMLARSRSLLYEGIREFTVVEHEGRVVAAGGLHIIWEDLAEIRALAVEEGMHTCHIHYDYQGIEAWALGTWKTNHPMTKAYRNRYLEYADSCAFIFHKVTAHSGDPYNEQADRLAKEAFLEEKEL